MRVLRTVERAIKNPSGGGVAAVVVRGPTARITKEASEEIGIVSGTHLLGLAAPWRRARAYCA